MNKEIKDETLQEGNPLTGDDVRNIIDDELSRRSFIATISRYPEIFIYVCEEQKANSTDELEKQALDSYIRIAETIIAERPSLWKTIKSWFTKKSNN